MIENKTKFYGGVAMMVAFIAILIIMFMPIFKGQNSLNYLDALFNSISKDKCHIFTHIFTNCNIFTVNFDAYLFILVTRPLLLCFKINEECAVCVKRQLFLNLAHTKH